MRTFRQATAAVLATLAMTASAPAAEITVTGAGSTFVWPILAKWSADFSAKTGNKINYQSIGSGAGLT